MQEEERTIPIIQHYQLLYKKYDIETLEYNIDRLGLKKLLQTQILTPEFCVKYILNPEEHGICKEDHYICLHDIVLYQPHISIEQLYILINKINK